LTQGEELGVEVLLSDRNTTGEACCLKIIRPLPFPQHNYLQKIAVLDEVVQMWNCWINVFEWIVHEKVRLPIGRALPQGGRPSLHQLHRCISH
jgi:hypothetical protein